MPEACAHDDCGPCTKWQACSLVVSGPCPKSWACTPTVAVGALNKLSQGEEREGNKKPVFSHSTQQGSLWPSTGSSPSSCPKHFPFQESTLQMIPWTTGTILSHQPHSKPEVWENLSVLGQGRRHLGGRDTVSLWSPGVIQVLTFSALLQRVLAWAVVSVARPAQDVCAFPSFARLARQSLFSSFSFPICDICLSPLRPAFPRSISFSFTEHLLCT